MNEAKAKARIEELEAEVDAISRKCEMYSQSSMVDSARYDADAEWANGLCDEIRELEDAIESGDFSAFVADEAPAPVYVESDPSDVPF